MIFLFFLVFLQIEAQPKIFDGNHYKFISSYALGKQNDLNLTFDKMQPTIHVEDVTYIEQVFRTYKIRNLTVIFRYE